MTRARISIAALSAAVLALAAVGLSQLGGSGASPASSPLRLTVAQMRARLAGSPPPLEALHAQANELLAGGLRGLRARLRSLRSQPTVVNKWASWCLPCRSEFGAFQRVSLSQGRAAAFIGIDVGESDRGEALSFLRDHPVSYPSYYDPSSAAGEAITDSSFTPVTVFYDRRGRQFIHQGPYPSAEKLEADVRRYALAG